MSEQSNNKLLTDVFVEGARKGWDIAIHNTIPNVIMAFVVIYILKVSGALDIIGKYLGFIMLPLGLPGESIAVFMAAFLSWGGSACARGVSSKRHSNGSGYRRADPGYGASRLYGAVYGARARRAGNSGQALPGAVWYLHPKRLSGDVRDESHRIKESL